MSNTLEVVLFFVLGGVILDNPFQYDVFHSCEVHFSFSVPALDVS